MCIHKSDQFRSVTKILLTGHNIYRVQTNSTFIIFPHFYICRILSFVKRSFLVVRTYSLGKICPQMRRSARSYRRVCCVVPWHINNTFIGIFCLQNLIKMSSFAPVCQVNRKSAHFTEKRPKWQNFAKCRKSWTSNVVKTIPP